MTPRSVRWVACSRSCALAIPKSTSFGCTVVSSATRKTLSGLDRKSTRLNSSHSQISYAVFCLKKKKKILTSTGPVNDHDRRSDATCSQKPLLEILQLRVRSRRWSEHYVSDVYLDPRASLHIL